MLAVAGQAHAEKRFAITEMAADRRERLTPQCIMRPSIARASKKTKKLS